MRWLCYLALGGCLAMAGIGCDKKEEGTPSSGPTETEGAGGESKGVDLPKKAAEVQSFIDKGRATYNQAKETGSELWGEAEKKMDQVADYARQKRPEVADSILTELEKHKSSLPQSMQDRLVSLRKQVDADKAATRPDSQ